MHSFYSNYSFAGNLGVGVVCVDMVTCSSLLDAVIKRRHTSGKVYTEIEDFFFHRQEGQILNLQKEKKKKYNNPQKVTLFKCGVFYNVKNHDEFLSSYTSNTYMLHLFIKMHRNKQTSHVNEHGLLHFLFFLLFARFVWWSVFFHNHRLYINPHSLVFRRQ